MFELYLENSSTQTKGLELLKNPKAKLDLDQCLLLCQKHHFQSGILYIYESTCRFKDALRYYAELKEYQHMKSICKSNQEREPGLWMHGLKILMNLEQENVPESIIMDFVTEMDALNVMEPLEILEILMGHPHITLGMVKEYLIQKMTRLKTQIQEMQSKTDSYHQEIESMQKQMHDLSHNPITFQSSKCELCRQLLELPCIHFLCQHSYHSR